MLRELVEETGFTSANVEAFGLRWVLLGDLAREPAGGMLGLYGASEAALVDGLIQSQLGPAPGYTT